MQIGCGVYRHAVHGRMYLYFWHYETKGGGRRQVNEYLGSVNSPRAWEEAARRCEGYYARMSQELDKARRATLASLGSAR